ncbi:MULTISPECIES: hypothetical protein [Edwardsiella]|uniref:Uncharacterized protein n=2 Tax=Edwardsiella anguillarum TaxID=1821960 RepID=A0A076LU24_9GAMM|nr:MULTISPECIES: hypothetical protein [Edwardsiella]AKM47991.1 hypothetical protein QY76_12230 [Edwardsiella sp. EA181011]GAJ68444.1 hypothetical protein MA13_contig00010-0180 [Edwardsiella piscicida]AIJ09968.1 Hypothetical protein ETEE_3547 [Edwardsiella anguillarum ET080813]AKR77617.1 hypothetical protein AAZ33_07985 [Edwardsiella sp. LADL05-105]KAB0588259.1 hypothetical protein F7P84_16375 [Edwardsiella anguillarum]
MTDVSSATSTTGRLRSFLQQQMQYWRMYLSRQSRKMGLEGKLRQALMLVSAVVMMTLLMAGFLLFNLVVLSVAIVGGLLALLRPRRPITQGPRHSNPF